MKIEDLFVRNIRYEGFESYPPKPLLMRSKDCEDFKSKRKNYKLMPYKFEKKVFICLFRNGEDLGIEKVFAFKNMLVDGALELRSGKVILLEIKYALSWLPCCNARVEFQRFIEEKLYRHISQKQPERGLIIFHRFGGKWALKTKKHPHGRGWDRFYEEEKILRLKFPTVPVDIAQLTNNRFKLCPQLRHEK